MANIRGFGDIRGNDNRRGGGFGGNGGGAPGGNDPSDSEAISALLGMNRDNQKDPRTETFWDMLHLNFCPTLKFRSFTSLISIINVCIFIASLVISGIQVDRDFLQVKNEPIISKISMNPIKIKSGSQYYRLITPCFFHLSFMHIIMNSFSLLIWGSFIETFCGTIKYMTIYLFAGVAGNLMSASINSDYANSIGASGCIMGITATLIGMLILNWMALGEGQYKEFRGMLTCVVIMITVFTLLFTAMPGKSTDNSKTDNWAHLGGFLGGFSLSMSIGKVFGRINEKPYEKRVRIVGWVLTATLVLSTFLPLLLNKN